MPLLVMPVSKLGLRHKLTKPAICRCGWRYLYAWIDDRNRAHPYWCPKCDIP